MAPLSVTQQTLASRLFNLDLPALKKTGQPLPEQGDISTLHRILDIASGNGEWAIRAAQAVPHLQIVAIEHDPQAVEQARAQATAQAINTVSFVTMDPFRPLDFPANSFDLVNARFLVGLLPAAVWPLMLKQFMRVLRPGGVLRLTEHDLPISNGPAFAQLGSLIAQALYQTKGSFSPDGRLLNVTPVLKHLLQNAGYQQVQQVVSVANFSAGTVANADLAQDFANTYQLVLPFLVQTGVTTQPEVEHLYQQMLSELHAEDFSAIGFYLTAWGIA